MKKTKSKLLALLLVTVLALAFSACGQSGKSYLLNETDLTEYSIVYAHGNLANKTLAENLAVELKGLTNTKFKCISDVNADSGHEILVGATNRVQSEASDGSYAISSVGDSVELLSDTTSGIIAAVNKFSAEIKKGSADFSTAVSDSYTDLAVKIMSFNIRMTNENRWSRLKNVIERNDPDLLGLQEVSTFWQSKFKTGLSKYTFIGEGRGDSSDEAGYILYKTDKFDVVESGTRWYTSTPTTSSKLSASTYTRIYTYATLKRKSDNMLFLYVNTHLDLNQSARMQSIEMLTDFIDESYPDLPTYITGDFNTDCNWTYIGGVWNELDFDDYDANDYLSDKGYSDSRLVSSITDDHYTYPTSLYPADSDATKTIIDYCFVKGSILVDSYAVDYAVPENVNTISGCGSDASDHFPIVAETVLY